MELVSHRNATGIDVNEETTALQEEKNYRLIYTKKHWKKKTKP
ncbi:MAG: hypothetical protein PHF89_02165 [Eubacteriales bacterium]|nr:hypothetical protein [Eubacteriales bacterium]